MFSLFLLFSLLIAPVTVQIRARYGENFRLGLVVHVWGLPIRFQMKQRSRPPVVDPLRLIKLLIRNISRIVRTFEWQYAGLRGTVSSGNAEGTALLWAVLQTVIPSLPLRVEAVHVEVAPDFYAVRSRLEGGCILFARLGKILALGARLGFDYVKAGGFERRGKAKWSIRSEA